MNDRKYSVTIGISAFNEEANIGNLLTSLLKQKEIGFRIEKIVIISDGSTDSTVDKARNIKSDKINVIDSKERKGLSARLNQLFALNKSDVLVKIDADVVPCSNLTLYYLLRGFRNGSALVSGHRVAVGRKTFVEKLCAIDDLVWHETKKDINGGLCILNHTGTISAMRKDLVKITRIPPGFVGTDDFVYLTARINRKPFNFIDKAVVLYRTPDNWSDYFKQHMRFTLARSILREHFGDWILEEYKIPLIFKIRGIIKGLSTSPLLTTTFVISNCFFKMQRILRNYRRLPYGWEIATSTKRKIEKRQEICIQH